MSAVKVFLAAVAVVTVYLVLTFVGYYLGLNTGR